MKQFIRYLKKFSLLIIALILVAILASAYELGYRVGPGVTLSRVGTLTLLNLSKGASVYTDTALRGTAEKAGNMTFDLVAGNHVVIVANPSDFPWSAIVDISSGENQTVDPILVSTSTKVQLLSGSAETTALATIASTTLPTFSHPLKLENGCALVYVENNQVLASATSARGCTTPSYLCLVGKCAPTIIFAPTNSLTAVLQYPGRQDALLVGLGNSLYVIALDPRSPQFFAPIVGAVAPPTFGQLPNGTIVAHEQKSVFSLSL